MSGPTASWSRDLGRLYLLYMAAGAAAIPAGVAYSLIAMAGWERWWTVVPLLAVGLASALLAWRFLERRLNQPGALRELPVQASEKADRQIPPQAANQRRA